jgi:uncharacterized damage-inducible protein DinB
MKEVFLSFAKYNKEANRTFLSIMDKLSNDEREKELGSYYGSLLGIARHLLEGEVFFSISRPLLITRRLLWRSLTA